MTILALSVTLNFLCETLRNNQVLLAVSQSVTKDGHSFTKSINDLPPTHIKKVANLLKVGNFNLFKRLQTKLGA
jgi:hypothetical protein